ncbi:Hypothetical predicted protein [Octopus vulgaris]|uniref:Uncharacterized protein n=1 Tax=Octopus vulgaris TaxID=6645 RepID=A0AA36BZ01_OCTVU|nr:Hypothetical predicted protein [Octopus vulgaris]
MGVQLLVQIQQENINAIPDSVKLVIYKNETAVVTMIFDGRNTTLESWFSQENLKSSPWNDLASDNPDTFSLPGYKSKRRFYITHHSGCAGDNGWLTVNEGSLYCPFDTSNHYPFIRYSDSKFKVIWSKGYGIGDSMAIFIRLRS